MKVHLKIASYFLLFLFLLATTIQGFDAIHHYKEERKVEKCRHQYSKNKTQISHAHHELEHCKICNFTFSTITYNEVYKLDFNKPILHQHYSYFHRKEITQFFKGSLFSLRAPPIFIV